MSIDIDILPLAVGLATIVIGAVVYRYIQKSKKPVDKAPKKSEDACSKKHGKPLVLPAGNWTAPVVPEPIDPISAKGHPKVLLDPNDKYALPLIRKQKISHDSYLFRFGLPTENHVLGLPIGQHVHLVATIDGTVVVRAYTPVSSDDDVGHVELVIKVYHRDVNPRFPEGGKMSQHINSLELGDTIFFKGPIGKLKYFGNGNFAIKQSRHEPPGPVHAKTINLIAGGTGIAPILQLIREILKNPADKTRLALLFANQTVDDILLRSELEDLVYDHKDQFKIWYIIDSHPTCEWPYSNGYIDFHVLHKHLYPPSDDTIVLMCGPPPMINLACHPNLETIGFPKDKRFSY